MCAIAVWGRCFDFIPRNPTRGDIPYSGVPTSRLPRLPRVPGWRGGPLAPCSSARGTRGTSLALEALRSHLLVPTHRKYTDRLSKSGCMLPCLLVGRSRKPKETKFLRIGSISSWDGCKQANKHEQPPAGAGGFPPCHRKWPQSPILHSHGQERGTWGGGCQTRRCDFCAGRSNRNQHVNHAVLAHTRV